MEAEKLPKARQGFWKTPNLRDTKDFFVLGCFGTRGSDSSLSRMTEIPSPLKDSQEASQETSPSASPNEHRTPATESHFQPMWDGPTIDSSIYSPAYYETFRRWNPADLAYFLMITCLHLFKHISVEAATLCLHLIGSVSSINPEKPKSSKVVVPKTMSTFLDGLRIEPKIRRTAFGMKSVSQSPDDEKIVDAGDAEGSDTETVAHDVCVMDGSEDAGSEDSSLTSSLPAAGLISADDDDILMFALQKLDLESETFPETSPNHDQTREQHADGFSDDDTLDEDFSDYEEACGDEPGFEFFNKNQNLATLQDITKNISLPSWIGRVPSTVGMRKGGKLKADEWVVLFQVMIIPAIISVLNEEDGATNFTDRDFGNSIVMYQSEDTRRTTTYRWGRINEIFITKPGPQNNPKAQLWFEVLQFSELRTAEKAKHGLDNWPNARMTVVYQSSKKKDLVRVDELVAQGVAWDTPEGCFGIKQPTTLIINLSKFFCNQTC
ncbi:uncharacterized protein MELLADRAFT_110395 [Melampsora larici-populina 98AG31]|uniref:Uncharacterized protein n=1 Tax=Melampsora larici-populina (strain 98AG31 / pathotype 3-4-7) TaxID=747676 RepID=F4RZN9_MELLP|nr:uncharacterized protein MELLADRAFT_110395 [Melampsora larici-populina 98AG31]EGG02034.1 hypothetical protein MELLADRAFT_110395 [Melampsora larici-populina 98AG31]